MRFLHTDFHAEAGQAVEVALSAPANVLLMDWSEFNNYKARRAYRYYGGYAARSPVRIGIPHAGHWYVVVNLGGYSGSVNASFSLIG